MGGKLCFLRYNLACFESWFMLCEHPEDCETSWRQGDVGHQVLVSKSWENTLLGQNHSHNVEHCPNP
jgi:hypothetical protein